MNIKIVCIIIVTFLMSLAVFAQDSNNWRISDYLKNLPKEYKTYEGDLPPLTEALTVIDDKNGYAAFKYEPGELYDNTYFSMALFKPEKGLPVLVVANTKYDFACFDYETFFLQKRGDKWVDVRLEVLPDLSKELFFIDSESYDHFQNLFKKLGDKVVSPVIRFEPPQIGTKMDATLEFCDYVSDDVSEMDVRNFLLASESANTVELSWNKETGKFEIVKSEE